MEPHNYDLNSDGSDNPLEYPRDWSVLFESYTTTAEDDSSQELATRGASANSPASESDRQACNDAIDNRCNICFVNYGEPDEDGRCEERMTLACGHVFGSECMRRIMDSPVRRCPMDRSPLPDLPGHMRRRSSSIPNWANMVLDWPVRRSAAEYRLPPIPELAAIQQDYTDVITNPYMTHEERFDALILHRQHLTARWQAVLDDLLEGDVANNVAEIASSPLLGSTTAQLQDVFRERHETDSAPDGFFGDRSQAEPETDQDQLLSRLHDLRLDQDPSERSYGTFAETPLVERQPRIDSAVAQASPAAEAAARTVQGRRQRTRSMSTDRRARRALIARFAPHPARASQNQRRARTNALSPVTIGPSAPVTALNDGHVQALRFPSRIHRDAFVEHITLSPSTGDRRPSSPRSLPLVPSNTPVIRSPTRLPSISQAERIQAARAYEMHYIEAVRQITQRDRATGRIGQLSERAHLRRNELREAVRSGDPSRTEKLN